MLIPDLVYGNEVLLSILAAILLAIAYLSRTYLTNKSTWVFRLRRVLWPSLDRLFRDRGRPFTRCKDTNEYVMTVSDSLPEINKAFHNHGHDLSVASTLKYRILDDGTTQKSVASWVYRETLNAKWQHHAYVFPSVVEPGAYDVYHHKEISTTYDPEGHTDGDRTPGDPDDVLVGVFPYHTVSGDIADYLQPCN